MLVTTTPTIEGAKITRYYGIVAGEVVLGINVFKDIAGVFRNITGGRSASYENETIRGREAAIAEMSSRAEALGANAIIGVDISYQALGGDNGMVMVSVMGTAVTLEPAT